MDSPSNERQPWLVVHWSLPEQTHQQMAAAWTLVTEARAAAEAAQHTSQLPASAPGNVGALLGFADRLSTCMGALAPQALTGAVVHQANRDGGRATASRYHDRWQKTYAQWQRDAEAMAQRSPLQPWSLQSIATALARQYLRAFNAGVETAAVPQDLQSLLKTAARSRLQGTSRSICFPQDVDKALAQAGIAPAVQQALQDLFVLIRSANTIRLRIDKTW